MSMKSNIVLETENLLLRLFSMDDVNKIFQMSQEDGMRQWIPDQVYGDIAQAEGVVKFLCAQYSNKPDPQNAPYVLGVELRKSGELIGHVGLGRADDAVEIGYAIEKKHQGKGFATECVSATSKWAINKLEIPFVLGIVASDNRASCRVLEKSGYIFVEEKGKSAFGRHCLCKIYRIAP